MGENLENHAKETCKVLVVANPANTNCLVASSCCKRIPAKNFSCLTRLDHNRALAEIASKCQVAVSDVKNIVIWGNHSRTQYPDVDHGYILKDGPKLAHGRRWVIRRTLTVSLLAESNSAGLKSSRPESSRPPCLRQMRSATICAHGWSLERSLARSCQWG